MNFSKNQKLIHTGLILLGLAGALFSQYYSGFGSTILQNYGSNLFFPFAIYFVIRNFLTEKSTVALIALGGVYLQELAQLLGMYSGVFDYIDLIVDLTGIILAMAVDWMINRIRLKKVHSIQ